MLVCRDIFESIQGTETSGGPVETLLPETKTPREAETVALVFTSSTAAPWPYNCTYFASATDRVI